MKKRVIALISTVLLVATMSMSAFAAPSVMAGVVTGIEKVTDKEDKDITGQIVVENMPEGQYTSELAYIKDYNNMKKELGNAYKSGMAIIDIKNVRVVGDASAINWDAEIVFTANGVTSANDVVILHYTGEAWEVIDAKAGNQTITAKFSSLSPVVFVAKGVKAPAMGETTMSSTMVMWAVVAMAAGVAGIVASKKRA